MTRYIQRHTLLTRITHGVAAISCILLALSGVFVFVPSLGGGIMGGDFTQMMRMLHRVLALPFILVPLAAVIISPKGFWHLLKEDIFAKWDKDDIVWMAKMPLYLFAPSKVHMPPQHRVKSGQRLADGMLLFMGIIMAISGMVMWLKTGLLPDGSIRWDMSPETFMVARLVHDVAFFLIVFVGLVHIYLGSGIFQPYRGTHRLMFGDGKLSESDAAYHWGYWANQELASGKNVVVVDDKKK